MKTNTRKLEMIGDFNPASSNVKWAGYKWVVRVQIDMVRNGQTHIEP